MKHKIKLFLQLILLLGGLLISNTNAQAGSGIPDVDMINGVINFTCTDTTKSASTSWQTEGYTVKNKKTGGTPTKPWGEFYLEDGMKTSRVDGNTTYTKFNIPKKTVSAEVEDAGVTVNTLKETNGHVYLNGILQVYKNGKPTGRYYKTESGIANAEPWNNKKDFADRFDIPVPYFPDTQEVKITFMESTKNEKKVIKRESLTWAYSHQLVGVGNKKVDEIQGVSSYYDIPKTLSIKGKTYHLYRSHSALLKHSVNSETGMRPISKESNGKTSLVSTTINPNTDAAAYQKEYNRMANRAYEVFDGGIEIVLVYRSFPKIGNNDKPQTADEISQELIEPDPYGMIKADNRGAEAFNVLLGIPTTENLYANGFTNNYLIDYQFKKISGTKQYKVTVKKNYHLSWTIPGSPGTENSPGTPDRPMSDTVTITKQYNIERPYSYWKVNGLHVYELDSFTMKNYALPGQSIKLTPSKEYEKPKVSYKKTQAYTVDPKIQTVALSGSVSGGSSRPSIPQEEFLREAERAVGPVQVRNDEVVFNGKTYMENTIKEETTKIPTKIPAISSLTTENILYKNKLEIAREKANGEWEN